MSTGEQLTAENLKEVIEKEYLISIQLIHTILGELQEIKHATSPGSEFEVNVVQNADLLKKLIEMRQIKLSDLNGGGEVNNDPCPHMSQGESGIHNSQSDDMRD